MNLLHLLIGGSLNYAHFLQVATASFLKKVTEEDWQVQPVFYFRADPHSLETNYAPHLPKQCHPAVHNDQLCQEVLKCFGEAL